MVNPTGKKLEKLLFGIFDEAIQGVDTYNHNGSMWLIFTDEMKWVVEYTKSQTLWYNYYFFKNEMEIIGLDCVENKDLIQKWFESRFLNRNEVEDTIQNGVKDTESTSCVSLKSVEDTIQNGVKHTEKSLQIDGSCVIEDTIQNGVKNTRASNTKFPLLIEDTIQNGVKNTYSGCLVKDLKVEDTIQNGVKRTSRCILLDLDLVEDTIQNGEKIK